MPIFVFYKLLPLYDFTWLLYLLIMANILMEMEIKVRRIKLNFWKKLIFFHFWNTWKPYLYTEVFMCGKGWSNVLVERWQAIFLFI